MRNFSTRLLAVCLMIAATTQAFAQNSVTFNVDMSCSGEATINNVNVTGPSVGWCANCMPLTDPDMDGIWSGTFDLPSGNFEFKYQVNDFASQENLVDDMQGGATCAPVTDYSGYANRQPDIQGDTTFNDTYGSCDDCPPPPAVGESPWCATETYHFMNPAETASSIYLTVANVSATSVFIEITSNGGGDVDNLIVTGLSLIHI